MPKLFILTDILENDPESGYFVVESVTYALNGRIGRYTDVNNIGDYKRFPEIINWIAKKHNLQIDDLEVVNLSKNTEISIADLL
jgi:hypothetical protein